MAFCHLTSRTKMFAYGHFELKRPVHFKPGHTGCGSVKPDCFIPLLYTIRCFASAHSNSWFIYLLLSLWFWGQDMLSDCISSWSSLTLFTLKLVPSQVLNGLPVKPLNAPNILILTVPRRYFCYDSLLLHVLDVRIYTLVHIYWNTLKTQHVIQCQFLPKDQIIPVIDNKMDKSVQLSCIRYKN